jgi:hypothetical protein
MQSAITPRSWWPTQSQEVPEGMLEQELGQIRALNHLRGWLWEPWFTASDPRPTSSELA